MRLLIPAGIAISLYAVTQGHAASSDLIFCSKQPERSERLACYEAAARIAERSMGREQRGPSVTGRAPPQSIPQREEPMQAYASGSSHYKGVTPPPVNRFQGAYATLGGSYGATEMVSFYYSSPSLLTPHGASVIGSAGYNHQIDAFVFGIEGSWRYGWENAEDSQTAYYYSGFPDIVGGRIAHFEFYSDASAHVSARFGVAVGETLIFARAGLGVSHTRSKISQTGFGQTCAASSYVLISGVYRLVCTAVAPFPSIPATGTSRWTPSALVGVGIEHNIGRYFGRVSGEVEGIDGGDFWATRAKAEVGVRF